VKQQLKFIRGTRRQAIIAGTLAVSVLIGGTAYAASRSVTASATDTVVSLSANKSLSSRGATKTPILTLALPASTSGTRYVITGQGNFVNFGPSDFTRCQVIVNGTQISSVSATVGNPGQSRSVGPAGLVVPFSLTGGVKVPAGGGTAVLRCWHDSSNGATPYIDGNASMWAHRSLSLKTATE
jgi:hypothetical protein